jgi:hypothetical protein
VKLNCQEYLKETNRKDAYVRYIQKLAEQHTKSQNYTEAAEALLLHARLYKWNDERLGEISGDFPAQTHRDRKVPLLDFILRFLQEQLYRRAIDLFNKGKMWERAIVLIKELRDEYQFGVYNYERLADLLVNHKFESF